MSSVVSTSGATREIPALLRTASTAPNSASPRSNAARTAAESRTSTLIGRARRPCSVTSRTTSHRSSSGRANTATSAPSRARAPAVASPMPEEAPVTRAMRVGISPMRSSFSWISSELLSGPDPFDLRSQPLLQLPCRQIAEVAGGAGQVELDLTIPVGQIARPDVEAGVRQEPREYFGGFENGRPVATRYKVG